MTRTPLAYYLAFTYLLVLANIAALFRQVSVEGPGQAAFLGAVFLSYGLLYVLPVALASVAAAGVASRMAQSRPRVATILPVLVGVAAAGALQLALLADRMLFERFGFHANGFVLNLLMTEGGLESMGSSASTERTVLAIAVGCFAVQGLLFFAATQIAARRAEEGLSRDTRRLAYAVGLVALVGVAQQGAYALASFQRNAPIVASAGVFPFYMPMTAKRALAKLGFERPERLSPRLRTKPVRLAYPTRPLERVPNAPSYNIVWLVAESLRADAMTPEIMPGASAFGERATRFYDHLSGGNGTRWGLFSMFYGLYGNYWFQFEDEHRGPVLIDELIARGYQLHIRTSAKFSYPEFDATVFAAVPRENLFEFDGGRDEGWIRDRKNIDALLAFLDGRDKSKPFMAFQFYESSHAQYYFPEESVVRRPYLEEVNYATLDAEKQRDLLFNRYLNSCHHLDSQITRVLRYLEEKELLDSTIVVVTGDHGEEFYEEGRWGHNSQFSDAQVRVPLVVHVPGRPAGRVDRMTSHLDIPATVLHALGISNPESDFSLGHDLFGPYRRNSAVISDWDQIAYVDGDVIATFCVSGFMAGNEKVKRRGGASLSSEETTQRLKGMRPKLLEMLAGLRKFTHSAGETDPPGARAAAVAVPADPAR